MEQYPRLEGDSKGHDAGQGVRGLPGVEVKVPGAPAEEEKAYHYVDSEGKRDHPDSTTHNIKYADFVAYYDGKQGWGVGQFLGDQGTAPPNTLKLRKLDTFHRFRSRREPRDYVWRYFWESRRGKNVLAGVSAMHDTKPTAKNTGGLTPFYVDVAKHDVIAVIHLNLDNTIHVDSWNDMLRAVDLHRPEASSLFINPST